VGGRNLPIPIGIEGRHQHCLNYCSDCENYKNLKKIIKIIKISGAYTKSDNTGGNDTVLNQTSGSVNDWT